MTNILIGLFLSVVVTNGAPEAIVTRSPDGRIAVEVGIDSVEHLYYRIVSDEKEVVLPSQFGIVADRADLGSGVSFSSVETRTIDETYPVLGVHSKALNRCRETTVTVKAANESWRLDIRAYDDGVAMRCRLSAKRDRHIQKEVTEWKLPPGTVTWYQEDLRWYEGTFTEAPLDGLSPGKEICLPVSAKLSSGKYIILTEANLVDYTDLAVRSAHEGTFKALFHAETEGWKTSDEVVQPWRVTLVANDLNSLVNSDLIRNLCPPPSPELVNASWIRPGRAVWNWWSTPSLIYGEQHKWVDWARQFGFEYYLIDAGWKKWQDGEKDSWACLTEVVNYAKSIGVDIWIWVHSNDVPDKAAREAFFEKAKDAGVVGVKIDFVAKCTREWSNWYEATLHDAAESKLLIDFHGAVKPTGRNRTWPNELTREAVRGHEWHILRYNRTLGPEHDCILPFNRFVLGPGDYTPTVFNPDELRGYTWSREAAQAIVFASPFLCYADYPDNYINTPAFDILKAIPSTWDETLVLPGSEIAKCAAFARRTGGEWFIGIINGPETSTLDIPLALIGEGSFSMKSLEDQPDRDDAVTANMRRLGKSDHLRLTIRPGGGFVGRIVKTAHVSSTGTM
jgi:alpha-glucosidase